MLGQVLGLELVLGQVPGLLQVLLMSQAGRHRQLQSLLRHFLLRRPEREPSVQLQT